MSFFPPLSLSSAQKEAFNRTPSAVPPDPAHLKCPNTHIDTHTQVSQGDFHPEPSNSFIFFFLQLQREMVIFPQRIILCVGV